MSKTKTGLKKYLSAMTGRMAMTLMCMALSLLSVRAATQVDINGPAGSGSFGLRVAVLPNGNIVVTDPDYDITTPQKIMDAGAVYLYNGATGVLISKLTGSRENDRVSSGGVTVLSNGDYVVSSPNWDNDFIPDAGATTLCRSATGLSGVVSSTNSLVGSLENDTVGYYGVVPLPNSNFLVASPNWNSQRGAVTFINVVAGTSGIVSSANSLVGTTAGERVGTGSNGQPGSAVLPNGNYVVVSSSWSNNRGAVTWGSATTGVSGVVSSANSLTGTSSSDSVGGDDGVVFLTNGNYVVPSSSWDNGALTNVGAVTLCDGAAGTSGTVSTANSLVGSLQNDRLGVVTPLSNGNYVVRGARTVTFGNGTTGVTGVASAANSLVGTMDDDLYLGSVQALANGNYVVISSYWDNNGIANAGAVTWCNGTTGRVGTISPSNSLVGTNVNEGVGGPGVTALPNGNYVVNSYFWNSIRGAVTFGNGTTGVVGTISSSNSLIGASFGDSVGFDGIKVLSNGNYVVSSSSWNLVRGAVTLCSGVTGLTGEVSATNSLVGTNFSDAVGRGGVVALTNGNYVVRSKDWNGNRGAATFANGVTGIVGEISASNSLVGSNPNDSVGFNVTPLVNGNYVMVSSTWNSNRGAATWGNGTTGVSGVVSSSNSLVGNAEGDAVGSIAVVRTLPNGNYVVRSTLSGSRGAVTWGDGTNGTSGVISSANSLVGSAPGDAIGNGGFFGNGIVAFANSSYVVLSTDWDNGAIENAGAVTLGAGTAPLTGEISATNSVLGTTDFGGQSLNYAYNSQSGLLVVGRPSSNIVTLFGNGNFRTAFDFDGDRRADISVFRAANSLWYLSQSQAGFTYTQFGLSTDKLVPADYDGDGKTDIAVFRGGDWYWIQSSDGQFRSAQFGLAGDQLVPADYDGDGRADIAVFRQGIWYLLNSSNNQSRIVQFGITSDKVVPADYDGDGKTDIAVYRDGNWHWLNSTDGSFHSVQFGLASDIPAARDYDGDGRADQAVYRNGYWYLLRSQSGFTAIQFGSTSDVPVPADYDGDGKVDIAFVRQEAGLNNWHWIQSSNGSFQQTQFGLATDKAVPSAFLQQP